MVSSLYDDRAGIECVLHEDGRLREEYNVIIGRVVHAEADDEAFSDHWLLNRGGLKPLHHLGGKDFCVPEDRQS